MDRIDDAKSAAREVRQRKPNFALKDFARIQTYGNIDTLDLLVSRFESAGLS